MYAYMYAYVAGRKLCIPRGAVRADTVLGTPAVPARITVFNLDDLTPLAGASDGAAFNPPTMEAFSTHGNGTMTVAKENSPTSFEVEQNLNTMNGARTIAYDSKTGRFFVMSVGRRCRRAS